MLPLDLTLVAVLLALGLDAVFGYPEFIYRKIGHPVTWIGALIAWLDTTLNKPRWSFEARRLSGVVALVALIAIPAGVTIALSAMVPDTPLGAAAIGVMAATLIAARSLHDHVRNVEGALRDGGLSAGRLAVAKIVGRDPDMLDEHGVARAAIESLAENASDGVVAPVFWFAVLGLPGLVAYKAVNTADSMIGHRSEKYLAFGWAAARFDDLINLPASRLTGLLFAAAAPVVPGGSALRSLRAMGRDASRHRSPNAGWPESALAGAMDLRLAGPRHYGGKLVDDATMGDGRREATADDIRRSLQLARVAWSILTVMIALVAVVLLSART